MSRPSPPTTGFGPSTPAQRCCMPWTPRPPAARSASPRTPSTPWAPRCTPTAWPSRANAGCGCTPTLPRPPRRWSTSWPVAALARAVGRMGWEFELLGRGSGRTPAAQLDALGGLGSDVFVAHGVHVDAADRALLRARGTTVVLCVRSNAVLQAGEPPVAAYLAEGNPLAVGTDSLASSPSLDLLAELQALHTVARRLIEAATIGGAQAMGLDDSGALRPGARADLAAFDIDVAGAANPEFNPYAALVTTGAGRCLGTCLLYT